MRKRETRYWRNVSCSLCFFRSLFLPVLESPMGEVIRFISRSDLDRARLIREARAIYASIFPAEKAPATE